MDRSRVSCSVFLKMVLDIILYVPQGVFNQFIDTILYRNYALNVKNNQTLFEYFAELCTYIIPNVYSNVQNQRNPQVTANTCCHFQGREISNETQLKVNKTLKYYIVCAHLCLSHIRQIFISDGFCLMMCSQPSKPVCQWNYLCNSRYSYSVLSAQMYCTLALS